jgi:hypothetical protein
MFDHIAMILELVLLVIIVAQGEAVRFYEREVWRMNSDRYRERAAWRQAKQKAQSKKIETATNTTAKITTLASTPTIVSATPKVGDVPGAADTNPSSPLV